MRALPLAALAVLLSACGAAEEGAAPVGGERVAGHGLEITIPDGWHGDVTKLGPHHAATLRAATFPLPREPDIGHEAQQTMGADDLFIAVADYGAIPGDGPRTPRSGLRVEREHVGNFEGFRRPIATTWADIAGTRLQVWVVAAREPTAAQLEQANAVLATLRVERARWRTHVDEARGLSVRIPPGWAVAGERLAPFLGDPKELLNVGTGAFKPGGERCAHVPERTLDALGPDDVLVTVVEFETPAGHDFPPRPPALLDAESWEPDSRDCLDEPNRLDYRLFPFTDAGRDFYVYVAFGERVSDARRREAAELLASLRFDRTGEVAFADPEVGVAGRHPRGWHRARGLTGFVEPREVVALASYPLRRGADAGECAPDTAREDMPAGGAFVWLLEYRTPLPPARFPERELQIPRDRLAGDVSCFPGPGWSTTFGAADRQFQLLVAFGGAPTAARLAEVDAILQSLEFDRLPPPPPDPYAGWPWLATSPGDSLKAPPGWHAASFERERTGGPYGPPLFFAANRKLRGLASETGPLPEATLANWFPDDAVLLWVLEESGRATLARDFVPIDRDWPEPEDFEPVEIFTKPAPQLRWLSTAGEFRGHRFSVWIAAGPNAAEKDVELALKSASSLAVSGCDRSPADPCVETR